MWMIPVHILAMLRGCQDLCRIVSGRALYASEWPLSHSSSPRSSRLLACCTSHGLSSTRAPSANSSQTDEFSDWLLPLPVVFSKSSQTRQSHRHQTLPVLPPGDLQWVYALLHCIFLAIKCKHDSIHKLEVRNIAHGHQRTNRPWP